MGPAGILKVNENDAPLDRHGQALLAAGRSVGMRLWKEGPREHDKIATVRDYETAGYVIGGRAELEMHGEVFSLHAGDSWIVPAGLEHRYRIVDDFVAIEATAPPAHIVARDL